MPSYGLLGAIVGAFGSSTLTYVLPALFHYKESAELHLWEKFQDLGLIVFGSILAVVGSIITIIEMIQVK